MRRLALFAAGCGAATFAAVYLLSDRAQLWAGAGFLLACTVLAAGCGRVPKRMRLCAMLCCAGAAAGLLWTWSYTAIFHRPADRLDGLTTDLSATVLDWPADTDYGAYVDVRLITPSAGRTVVRLYIDKRYGDLRPGDHVEALAHFTRADHTSKGEPIRYFEARGILLTAVAYGELTCERPARLPLSCFPALLAQRMKDAIAAAAPPDSAAVLIAVVTGDKSGLDSSFHASLRRAGLSHTVAVSGMHLVFLVSFLELLSGRGRRRTVLICLPVTALFALMTGGGASVVRAAVMIDLLLIAPLFDRERDGLTSLGAALLLLLGHNPYAAADVGLQLSFAAVLGIMTFGDRLQKYLLDTLGAEEDRRSDGRRPLYRLLCGLAGSFSMTLGALAFTVPLSMIYFGSVSLIAPLSNLVTLWLVALIFVLGFLLGIAGMIFAPAAAWIAFAARAAVHLLRRIVVMLAKIPFAGISADSRYCAAWLCLLYAVVFLALLLPGRKRMGLILAALGATLSVALLFTALSLRRGEMTIQALDVGQGQSVLIRSGSSFVLADCGGDKVPDAGVTAADSLERMGTRKLDLLIVSHYHSDHTNGVLSLLDRVNVKCIALPDVEPESALRGAILARADALGIGVRFIRRETEIPLDNGSVLTLLPPLGNGGETNELGLSVLYTCGDYDVLITGDMGQSVEKLLLASTPLPDTELMIAGHHGSRYANSQKLLDAVRPDTVIISVGRDNSYGHPAPETLARFEQIGAQVYRTDQMGTVTVQAWPHRR